MASINAAEMAKLTFEERIEIQEQFKVVSTISLEKNIVFSLFDFSLNYVFPLSQRCDTWIYRSYAQVDTLYFINN